MNDSIWIGGVSSGSTAKGIRLAHKMVDEFSSVHKIYVVVRKSDGKFLRKNIKGYIDWKSIIQLESIKNPTSYDLDVLQRSLNVIDDYFTDDLGKARIMASPKVAKNNCPTWHIWMSSGTYFDVDWIKDGTCEVREMVCSFSEDSV